MLNNYNGQTNQNSLNTEEGVSEPTIAPQETRPRRRTRGEPLGTLRSHRRRRASPPGHPQKQDQELEEASPAGLPLEPE